MYLPCRTKSVLYDNWPPLKLIYCLLSQCHICRYSELKYLYHGFILGCWCSKIKPRPKAVKLFLTRLRLMIWITNEVVFAKRRAEVICSCIFCRQSFGVELTDKDSIKLVLRQSSEPMKDTSVKGSSLADFQKGKCEWPIISVFWQAWTNMTTPP